MIMAIDKSLRDSAQLFILELNDLRQLVKRFRNEIEAGLHGRESSLKMLPAYVGRPTGEEKGAFIVLDMGGTHVRVMSVRLMGDRNAAIEDIVRHPIPPRLRRGNGESLFDYLAQAVRAFFSSHDIPPRPLAFTFSYPVAQYSLSSGILIRWTKGFTVSGVEGQDVGALLVTALKRAGCADLPFMTLINDTVGTLLAASYRDSTCDMAVILGTGTNACYPERAELLSCPGPFPQGEVIVNLEWGGFSALRRNAYDRLLDRQSPNPGEQRMEKMVSGLYLGELVRLVLCDLMRREKLSPSVTALPLTKPYALTSKHLARLITTCPPGMEDVIELIHHVVTRSARIIASGIIAVVTHQDPTLQNSHTVAVDGALFTGYPGYQDKLEATIAALLPAEKARITLIPEREGSGVGAAVAAAIALYR